MPFIIGPLGGLWIEMHVGHGLGLEHDLGLGVGPIYKPFWDHIRKAIFPYNLVINSSLVKAL